MKKMIIFIAAFWLGIVLLYSISNEITILCGKEVLLKTVPVDPKDILRGDYVDLNFEITNVVYDREKIKGNYWDKDIFVLLKTDENNVAHAYDVSLIKPEKEFFIKGRVKDSDYKNKRLTIKYGIESYFVKQKTGLELERELAKGAYSKVRIDKFGRAKVLGFVK